MFLSACFGNKPVSNGELIRTKNCLVLENCWSAQRHQIQIWVLMNQLSFSSCRLLGRHVGQRHEWYERELAWRYGASAAQHSWVWPQCNALLVEPLGMLVVDFQKLCESWTLEFLQLDRFWSDLRLISDANWQLHIAFHHPVRQEGFKRYAKAFQLSVRVVRECFL